jgi:hypothetical protein
MELTRKELYDLVWSEPMSTLCKRFGLSDNGLRKQCKSMDIPTPPLGYWAKLKAGYKVKITPFPAKTKSKKQSTVLNEIPQNDETKVEVAPPNRFKLRELEILSGDTSVYIVPEVLYAKDPLIIDTKEKYRLEKEENIYLNRNPYKSEIKATLNLYVEYKSINNALLIYETIIKALKSRGHDIKIKDYKTYAVVNGEEISINITEKSKQDPNTVDNYGRKGTIYTGELSFNINYDYYYKFTFRNKSTFNDTKFTKLKDKIIAIIANLEVNSEQMKEARIEAEERERIRKEEERIRQEFKARQEKELKEFKSLFSMAELLHKTNILRQYISTYEQFVKEHGEMDEDISNKLQWAKEKADWLDPFISKEDKYLDKYDKNDILQRESPEYHSWRYEDSHSTYYNYSFWAKPYWRR